MYERFTDRARKVMQLANQEAMRFNHEYIGTEHILLGLTLEGSGVAANVLKNLNVNLRQVRREVEKIVMAGPDMVAMGKLPQTPRTKKVLEYALQEARDLNHSYVGTEHLLLGLLREVEGVGAQVLMNLGLELNNVRDEVLRLLSGTELESAPSELARKPSKRRKRRPLPDHIVEQIEALDAGIAKLAQEKEDAVVASDFEAAARLRDQGYELEKKRKAALRGAGVRRRRRAWDYEILVALTGPDGTPADERALGLVRKRLQERFGGFFFGRQRLAGAWQVGPSTLHGEIAVLRVIAESKPDAEHPTAFLVRLKEELARDLNFENIVIVARRVELI